MADSRILRGGRSIGSEGGLATPAPSSALSTAAMAFDEGFGHHVDDHHVDNDHVENRISTWPGGWAE